MQGKTVKSGESSTRGTCGAGATLTCNEAYHLGGSTCKDEGTLAVCDQPANLKSKSAQADKGIAQKSGYCCGGGLLVAASVHSCGSNESLCNQAGETLRM